MTDRERSLEEAILALVKAIDLLQFAYIPEGHVFPEECFTAGPLTGNHMLDHVVCPGCIAEAAVDAAISKAEGLLGTLKRTKWGDEE